MKLVSSREIAMTQTALMPRTQRLILAGPTGSLDAYIHAVGSIPVLSADEEHALALRFRDAQDLDGARQLVLHHLRFVVHVARGYLGYGLPLGDLIQEGNIGLMKADRKSTRLNSSHQKISYAVFCLKKKKK